MRSTTTPCLGIVAAGFAVASACQSRLELGRESSASTGGASTGGASNGGEDGAGGVASACAPGYEQRESKLPVDVIFVLDNSSSMAENIEAFQASISDALAVILEQSSIDYRIVLVSRYGKVGEPVGDTDNPVCVGPPLTELDCSAPPVPPTLTSSRFFHYSADIDSDDAWCQLLRGFDTADELPAGDRAWTPLAPEGWSQFLRVEAEKSLIVVTDASVDCSVGTDTFSDSDFRAAARDFDRALTTLSPEHFGAPSARRYTFHSVVGIYENDPPDVPWPPDVLIAAECGGDVSSAGLAYQELSLLTGGLRFPSCRATEIDSFFRALADGIDTQVTCRPIE